MINKETVGNIYLLDEIVKNPKGHYFLEISNSIDMPFPPGTETAECKGILSLGGKKISCLVNEIITEETSFNEIINGIKIIVYEERKITCSEYSIEDIKETTEVKIERICEKSGLKIDYEKLEQYKFEEYATDKYQSRNGIIFYDNIYICPAAYKRGIDHFQVFLQENTLSIKGENVYECTFSMIDTARKFPNRLFEKICKVLDSEKPINLTERQFWEKAKTYTKYVQYISLKTDMHFLQYYRGDVYLCVGEEKYRINPEHTEIMVKKYFDCKDEISMNNLFAKAILIGTAYYVTM